MLKFLLDEHISTAVAEQIAARRPDISVVALVSFGGGLLLGMPDSAVLTTARQHNLTLVTYDKSTVVPLLRDLANRGIAHAGVLCLDRNTTPQENVGAIVRRLEQAFDAYRDLDWTDRIIFVPV